MWERRKEKTWADKKVKKGIKRGLCKLIIVIFVFSIHTAVCLAPAHIINIVLEKQKISQQIT